jgi:hypothetical protein
VEYEYPSAQDMNTQLKKIQTKNMHVREKSKKRGRNWQDQLNIIGIINFSKYFFANTFIIQEYKGSWNESSKKRSSWSPFILP